MSTQDQEAFMRTGADWGANYQAKMFYEVETQIAEDWANTYGVAVIKPTDAEMKILRDAAAEVIQELAEEKDEEMGWPGTAEAFLKKCDGLRDKYQAEVDEKGFPWE